MDEISHFDLTTTSGNVSVLNGNSAFLVCSVENLGKNVVSWIRHSDINVLSVGKLKYTQDFRISSLQNDSTWTLKVSFSSLLENLGNNLSLFFVLINLMSD